MEKPACFLPSLLCSHLYAVYMRSTIRVRDPILVKALAKMLLSSVGMLAGNVTGVVFAPPSFRPEAGEGLLKPV